MHVKTEYEDVNKVLELLTNGLVELLKDQLVGVYLTGSLTYGDFNRDSSDIDFLAVLETELTDSQLEKVKELHEVIASEVPHWAKSLEGSYITRDMLGNLEVPEKERPYVNGGKVSYCAYGNEWVINLYALQECGQILYGADLQLILPEVTIEHVRKASKEDLLRDWATKIDDPNAFTHSMYDSDHLKNYAVLTMCRILHRAKNDHIASKKVASKWVKEEYPQWRELVERAEVWVHGRTMGGDKEVQDFLKFTLEEVQEN